MVKDKDKDWGQFIRLRKHIAERLPKDISKITDPIRLVIGTMTDPYQPSERKERLTRKALEIILENPSKFSKVGIFTRSPFIVDDLDLIAQLPRARVHFTVTPYDTSVMSKIEPVAIPIAKRLETIRKIKDAGIKTQVNISPILPVWSDLHIEGILKEVSEIGVDEFFIDPMQSYKEAITAIDNAMGNDEIGDQWKEIRKLVTDKDAYQEWKLDNCNQCIDYWAKYENNKTLAVWLDHITHISMNMTTGDILDWKNYGEDDPNPTPVPTPEAVV